MARSLPTTLTDDARAFIDAHRVGRLATADDRSRPHVIPVCYARVDDRLYFVVDDKPKQAGRRLKRLRNITANPHVALVIDDYDEDWSHLAYLLIHCEATVVEAEAEYTRGLQALRERYPQYEAMPLRQATHPMVRMGVRDWHLWVART